MPCLPIYSFSLVGTRKLRRAIYLEATGSQEHITKGKSTRFLSLRSDRPELRQLLRMSTFPAISRDDQGVAKTTDPDKLSPPKRLFRFSMQHQHISENNGVGPYSLYSSILQRRLPFAFVSSFLKRRWL